MNDYSIEVASERIVDPRTRGYFNEVYGCYSAGHYRSAVVMLWSIVVTDILFKLDQLENAYGDATAKAILSEIGDLRKNNPKSPEWEAELINKVASRTDLIDNVEVTFLQALQTHRHLSAHPVLTGHEALFSPNKETARAHIRNVLDSVLTKPPIMSRKVFDAFIEDVEQISRLSPGTDGLTKFLEAKYFKHFSNATFIHIFKSLWRVCFKAVDPRCETNRQINGQALEVVFSSRKSELLSAIEGDRDWFSDVSFTDGHFVSMAQFFRRNPEVYPLMTDASKSPIDDYSKLTIDHFALTWFVSDSPEAHIEAINERILGEENLGLESYQPFSESLRTADCFPEVLELGIKSFGNSGGYDSADSRFDKMIQPFLPDYDVILLTKLLAAIEGNGQVSGRRRAWEDNRKVKKRIDEVDPDLDLAGFPDFKSSIGI
jgi:hypothetical protein